MQRSLTQEPAVASTRHQQAVIKPFAGPNTRVHRIPQRDVRRYERAAASGDGCPECHCIRCGNGNQTVMPASRAAATDTPFASGTCVNLWLSEFAATISLPTTNEATAMATNAMMTYAAMLLGDDCTSRRRDCAADGSAAHVFSMHRAVAASSGRALAERFSWSIWETHTTADHGRNRTCPHGM